MVMAHLYLNQRQRILYLGIHDILYTWWLLMKKNDSPSQQNRILSEYEKHVIAKLNDSSSDEVSIDTTGMDDAQVISITKALKQTNVPHINFILDQFKEAHHSTLIFNHFQTNRYIKTLSGLDSLTDEQKQKLDQWIGSPRKKSESQALTAQDYTGEQAAASSTHDNPQRVINTTKLDDSAVPVDMVNATDITNYIID